MENVFVTTDKVNKTVCQHNNTVLLKYTMDLVLVQIHADSIHKSNIFFQCSMHTLFEIYLQLYMCHCVCY